MNGPRQKGILSVGTIRCNIPKNCALSSEKALQEQTDKIKHMSLINFQLDIANDILKASQTVLPSKRDRPSLSLLVTMDSSPSLSTVSKLGS